MTLRAKKTISIPSPKEKPISTIPQEVSNRDLPGPGLRMAVLGGGGFGGVMLAALF